MEVFKVAGNGPLSGKVHIGGAKNAALPILAASLLTEEAVELHNVPDLSDSRSMVAILQHVGAQVDKISTGEYRPI